MDYKIYKLRFTSPLHIGDERSDYDNSLTTIHSDTLYAALTACIAKVGGSHIAEKGDLGFSVSSLFPYYQRKEKSTPIYFLPKSKRVELPNENQLTIAKKIKKVQWLGLSYFQKQIDGISLFKGVNLNHVRGGYLCEQEIPQDFMYSEVQTRVAVPRYGVDGHKDDAEPFYMERIRFSDHSGMFFLAAGDTTHLENALNVLQYEGIGTDRTVGNGYFAWEKGKKEDLKIRFSSSSKMMSLSMFCPKPSEVPNLLKGNDTSYDFKRRGGWVTSAGHNTIRKNTVYMFTEGSVFNAQKSIEGIETYGEIHDLKPGILKSKVPHPMWRSGKAIFIPVK